MTEDPPITCVYCGKPIWPGESLTAITKTSLDENGEPDFETHAFVGAAHPECWDREGPDAAEK